MPSYRVFTLAVFVAAVFASTCGGGGGTSVVPPVPPTVPAPVPAVPKPPVVPPVPPTVPAPVPAPAPSPAVPPARSAGLVTIRGNVHAIASNLLAGKLTQLYLDGNQYGVLPSEVNRVLFLSDRRGWDKDGLAFGVVSPTGDVQINNTCNNDRGQWAVLTNGGAIVWFSADPAKGWVRDGVPSKLVGELVEYGAHGYQPAKLVYGASTLTIDFGSDCLGGFSPSLVGTGYTFVWNSDIDGWGVASKKRATPVWDATLLKWTVSMAGITCGQRGTLSVFKPGETVPHAWFTVPAIVANPLWQLVGVGLYHNAAAGEHAIVLNCS